MSNQFKSYLKSLNFDSLSINNNDIIKNSIILRIDDIIVLYFNSNIENYNICIFDKDFNIFYMDDKPILLYKNTFNRLNQLLNEFLNNWEKINIYEHIGDIVYLIKHSDKKYILYKYNNSYKLDNIDNCIYKKLFNNIEFVENNVIKLSLITLKYNKILYYNNNDIIDNVRIYKDKKVHFSGIDELNFDLEKTSQIIEIKKKITSNGYIIEYNNKDYIINYNIYQKIIDMIPYYSNINKCYLELYKNDNLSFMINFMSNYCHDIINRVNLSVKNIAKEILNIYHFTRKNQNKELYDLLSDTYKLILSDLHKIFIYSRKYDDMNQNDDDKDFLEKTTMNIDIIYKYIKKIDTDLLIKLYINREKLISDIKNIKINYDIFTNTPTQYKMILNNCVHTKTMSVLLLN